MYARYSAFSASQKSGNLPSTEITFCQFGSRSHATCGFPALRALWCEPDSRRSADARNFVSRCRVKVGVAAAAVDGTVTDANVGEAVRIVGADGNIAGHVSHVIMNARVPLQRHHRIQVAERCERVICFPCEWPRAD